MELIVGGVAARIEAKQKASNAYSNLSRLADAAGIARVTFFRKMKDEEAFTVRELRKIAIALGCKVSDLVAGSAA